MWNLTAGVWREKFAMSKPCLSIFDFPRLKRAAMGWCYKQAAGFLWKINVIQSSELVSKHLVSQAEGRKQIHMFSLPLGSWPPTVVLVPVYFQGLFLRETCSIKDCFCIGHPHALLLFAAHVCLAGISGKTATEWKKRISHTKIPTDGPQILATN